MSRLVALGLLGAMLLAARPAAAWDPEADPAAGVVADPGPGAAADPVALADPAPVEPPPGVYLVTDTYAGDVVTHAGPVTTYETVTIHETTGSFARVLETVPTGARSALDSSAFNGRATLSDGRPVAGTFYENLVRTESGFVAVSVVFFQDDSEVALARARVTPVVETPTPPAGGAEPAPEPGPFRPAAPAPETERLRPDTEPSAPSESNGVRSIEVLRGRLVAISLAAPPSLVRWRYLSGEATVSGALAGTAADPFRARWDRLAPPGEAWIVRFALEFGDGSRRELQLRILVRAPGLVE